MDAKIKFEDEPTKINCIRFNQHNTHIICATDKGYKMFDTASFKEVGSYVDDVEFCYGEMLYCTNILALIGSGKTTSYPDTQVILWDDAQYKQVGEMVFKKKVNSVKLNRKKIVAVLDRDIYVYSFSDLSLITNIRTVYNPNGLCILTHDYCQDIMVCPMLVEGGVRIDFYDLKKTEFINAHKSELSYIALNNTGTRLATSSKKGTLIRIFDTHTREIIQVLRRGFENATIQSIVFHPTSKWLAATSDTGTIHVFQLVSPNEKVTSNWATPQATPPTETINTSSIFSFIKNYLPTTMTPDYLSYEWAPAKYTIDSPKSVLCFGQDQNILIIVGYDGKFHKVKFNENKPGESCELIEQGFFMNMEKND